MATLKHRTTFFSAVFSYAEILSIDICIGVIGSGALAASLLHAKMRLVWWFILPAAVWVIYTADHLLDAKKIGKEIVNARHKFHREHFTVLAILAAIVALGCLIAAPLYLSDLVLQGGLFLCLLAALHLALAFWGKIRIGKEISVAVVYSLGVWFGPYLRRECSVSWLHITGFGLFILAALLNLFMNSIMEYEMDKRENLRFATGIFSLNRIRVFVMVSSWFSSLAILIILKYVIKHRLEMSVLAGFCFLFVLCAVPGFIISDEAFYKKDRRYRVLAEWIFALGILLLFIPQ